MKKPSSTAIRSAVPLTQRPERGPDPLAGHCSICGKPADSALLQAWREHDERDLPIQGPEALVFLDSSHADCKAILDAHPRLYAEVTGEPGAFPRLCGPCVNRRGLGCTHPDLKANGGEGLKVGLDNAIFARVHLCGRNGRVRPVHHALDCAGQQLPGETT